jgi:hypothetical protein
MIKKVILHILTIIPMALVKYFLTLVGFFVVPIALRKAKDVGEPLYGNYAYSEGNEERYLWQERHLPKWAWLFDNDSDGTLGDKRGWWRHERCEGHPESFWNQYRWLALRNPVNNLRRIWPFFMDGTGMEKEYIGDYRVDDDTGMGGWHFVWSGWRTGFYLIKEYGFMNRSLEIRTGWKLRPGPQEKIGFTVLIHPWRRL